MLAALAQSTAADPINAKNSLTFPATCDDGQTIQVVVNGNGAWTPAHVVGASGVHPAGLDLTFEFTPTGEPTQTETDIRSKPNPHGTW